MMTVDQFVSTTQDPPVRGFLHRPNSPVQVGLVLTHGAGGNCNSPMLIALSEAFADSGITVLRCNLPFRQARSFGSPRPGDAAKDRQGLANAAAEMRKVGAKRVLLGGQSYGGRQASMLVAETKNLVDGLLLLSYPLHPPGRAQQQRTEHFPKVLVPTLFVHGCNDPFASDDEIEIALPLISAKTCIIHAKGVGHDLGFSGKKRNKELLPQIVEELKALLLGTDEQH
jgi:predicted alpha/beta-hydrolase family hydrolase